MFWEHLEYPTESSRKEECYDFEHVHQTCKRLMKRALRKQLEQTVQFENAEFAERVRSDDAKEAFRAFFAKRQPISHPQ